MTTLTISVASTFHSGHYNTVFSGDIDSDDFPVSTCAIGSKALPREVFINGSIVCAYYGVGRLHIMLSAGSKFEIGARLAVVAGGVQQ